MKLSVASSLLILPQPPGAARLGSLMPEIISRNLGHERCWYGDGSIDPSLRTAIFRALRTRCRQIVR